jgi:hypothetical protein
MREMSVAEQRYKAVLAVIADRRTVTEVARDLGVSRQTMHCWLARYGEETFQEVLLPVTMAACKDSEHRRGHDRPGGRMRGGYTGPLKTGGYIFGGDTYERLARREDIEAKLETRL